MKGSHRVIRNVLQAQEVVCDVVFRRPFGIGFHKLFGSVMLDHSVHALPDFSVTTKPFSFSAILFNSAQLVADRSVEASSKAFSARSVVTLADHSVLTSSDRSIKTFLRPFGQTVSNRSVLAVSDPETPPLEGPLQLPLEGPTAKLLSSLVGPLPPGKIGLSPGHYNHFPAKIKVNPLQGKLAKGGGMGELIERHWTKKLAPYNLRKESMC
ncbi:hypothetical protein LR48_Vigan04g142600 [Vigna angularis]|uniref:Uncharacterized protein n=1 Tax=Phaseolus angularis TaxID=3914 RepID=A0A0L9UER2_PHAAN|nr:hypothetical protein LR48_Vigan04g142600 [Vigna angularis]